MSEVTEGQRASRLLIVEDDDAQLRTLTALMQDEGFEVIGRTTASAALEQLNRQDIGVAVVDLRLPDLDGTQLLEKLGALPRKVHTIIHTAYSSFASAKAAVNRGAFAYVEKAGDPEELIRQVHRAFRAYFNRYTDDLEAAVAERTRDLREANQMLRGEITERKRAEVELRRRKEHFQSIIENATDVVMIVGADGTVSYVSPSVQRLLGHRPEDVTGRSIFDFLHPDDLPSVTETFARTVRDASYLRSAELRVRHQDGSWRTFEAIAKNLLEHPAVGGIVINSRDITERKQAEEGLRVSEERFRQLAENVREVFWITDPKKTRMIYVSPAYEQIWGRTCKSLYERPRSFLDALHPEDRERVISTLERQARGHPIDVEYRITQPGGSVRWIRSRGSPVRNEHGDVYRIAGIAEDITERREAEQALRESEERFRRTFDEAPIGTAIVSLDYRFVRVNEALCRITGYSEKELISLGLPDISHPDDLAADLEQARRLAAGEIDHYDLDKRYLRKDGAVVWVHLSVRLMKEASGRGLYFLPVMEDITERKRAEERIRQHQEKLAHVSRISTMGEMASGIAHELNQPLFSIMNYAEACKLMVQSGRGGSDEIIANLDKVVAVADNAGDIVRRLRNFIRKREPRRSTVDINRLVREVTHAVRAEAQRSDVQVRLELSPKIPPVLADSILIQQVTLNLARNAIEAMSENEAEQRELIIRTSVVGIDEVEVAVCDSGPGVPAEPMDRLFEPFFTTKPEGLGLGLSISQSIVEANGGRLVAGPNPDRGMTFRFTLPMTSGDQNHGV